MSLFNRDSIKTKLNIDLKKNPPLEVMFNIDISITLYRLTSTYIWIAMSTKENPYTTLFIYKTTRVRFKELKGRGITADKFLNDLMDRLEAKE